MESDKSQTPSTKLQTPKQVLNFGHCYLFDICDLLFAIFSHSSTPTSSFCLVTTSIGNLEMLRLNTI